ncbi:hypothetical protein ACNKHN_16180 [Shigella flexneri]
MGIAPVYAENRRCLERVGWQLADVNLIEANELLHRRFRLARCLNGMSIR